MEQERDHEDYIYNSFYLMKLPNMMMYHLGVISSLAVLREGYTYLQGNSDRGEEHIKAITEHLDFVLSAIEKFNWYSSITDFFSKYRVTPFIGIAAGFVLSTDDLVRANVCNQFTPYDKVIYIYIFHFINDDDVKLTILKIIIRL